MFGKLNRIWWNRLHKVGHAQRKQAAKLFKAMISKPKRAAARKPTPAPTRPPPRVAVRSASPPGTWRYAYYTSPGVTARRMRYRLFLPACASAPDAAMPLIVMLHGCQQSTADFAAGTRMNQLAEAKGYAVLYPEQSLRTHAQRCWKWYDAATQRGSGDIETIVQMVEEIADKHAIDRRRIYACGISAGAAMAQILAFTQPHLIAAVGLHSGPVFGTCRSATGAYGVMQHGGSNPLAPIKKLLAANPDFLRMPAILISGDDDTLVRPINQSQLIDQFMLLNEAANIVPLPLVTKTFGRISKKFPHKNAMRIQDFAAGPTVIIRSVRIGRLGHAWSGGDDALPFHAKGPDAGKLMLAFFARHRRNN